MGGAAARGISVAALASQISEDRTAAIVALVIEDVREAQADLGRRDLAGMAVSGVTADATAAVDQPGADRAVSAVRLHSAADVDSVVRRDVGDKTVGAAHQIAVGLASAAIVVLVSLDLAVVQTDLDEATVATVLGRGLLASRTSADREVPDATAGVLVLMAPWDRVIRWVRADGRDPMAREV
jgi:hypothetical protein